jgi:hypothetical protein
LSVDASVLGLVDTATLGSQSAPPLSDAANRGRYVRLLGLSRRSYHDSPTIPRWLTVTMGIRLLGRFPGSSPPASSLTMRGGLQVCPWSSEVARKIWVRHSFLASGQTAYRRPR